MSARRIPGKLIMILIRIVCFAAGVLLAAYCCGELLFSAFYTETEASVTGVRYYRQKDDRRGMTVISAYLDYAFEVGGTGYSGKTVEKGEISLGGDESGFIERTGSLKEVGIRYFPLFPSWNRGTDGTGSGAKDIILMVSGLLVGTAAAVLSALPYGRLKMKRTEKKAGKAARECPACGHVDRNSSRFCPKCGTKLDRPEKTE
ncbi:MAG: zinc ribbon domain-containing protein [Clostridia bacterium]|nr:zinc ribbon domain-containing protein [Clostridia bacterium]